MAGSALKEHRGPEILAPAGNAFKLRTAVRYGADAVYIAGRSFGLRSAADNFSEGEIIEACRFAHAHGTKVYVVLNAFMFSDELDRLPEFLACLETAQVDAVIVSDLGVVETTRRHSRIPIHLSTQASTLNSRAAAFWRELGVSRIVLGREATIAEAAAIKEESGVEVELFGHGAMCMAFSGQCTISNFTAGRDSNRGGCIQSCRFHYQLHKDREDTNYTETGTILSSKDLMSLDLMENFVRAGIDSLKIEGRMKSPFYVATTTRAYRMARDQVVAGKSDVDRLFSELNTLSRRDYTRGNLAGKAGADSVYRQDRAKPQQTHFYLGHLLEDSANGRVLLQLRNGLERGSSIEILPPREEPVSLRVEEIFDLRGLPIEAGKPNQVVSIPCEHTHFQREWIVRAAHVEHQQQFAV